MIHTIDLDYLGTPGAIASYIVVSDSGPFMIETGPANTTDALARGLAELGFVPSDVGHVFVSHIHFDHAGASGWMARHGAQVHVHEFGAAHLADPTRLVNSARRIYGDEMEERWGMIEPVPADQVIAVNDGAVTEIGGVKIKAIETPGHARHHHAFAIDTDDGRIAFTGDAAGMFVNEGPVWAGVPTPPPEFELAAWISSVERLEREMFDRIYPTHFGPVEDPGAHLSRVKQSLRDHVGFVHELMDEGVERDEMLARYTDWFADGARDAGVPEEKISFYVTDTMAGMNLSGIMRYWKKMAERLGR